MEFKSTSISYEQTKAFTDLIEAYANDDVRFKEFITEFPNEQGVKLALDKKRKGSVNRELLVKVLREQYAQSRIESKSIDKLLDRNCFSVCTAHQPNIFSGYLYSIYKIVHAIKLAQSLEKKLDESFVPVFFIGSEDHDIEEIGAFLFADKKHQWSPTQLGACGRMSTDSLQSIRDEVLSALGIDMAWLKKIVEQAYDGKRNLTEATRFFYHQLFGDHGLIILDADHPELKKIFLPVVEEELEKNISSSLVQAQIEKLSKHFKIQVEAREINLFYLDDKKRERIIESKDGSIVLNDGSEIQMSDITARHYSPNVILRPLYQEMILPNIAFVGGGSEVAYWMELKSLFDHFKISFPIIFQRNSVALLSRKAGQKMRALGIANSFDSKDQVLKAKSVERAEYQDLEKQLENIRKSYELATNAAQSISPSLKVSAEAQIAKIEKLHKRLLQKYRAHLKRQETDISDAMDVIHSELKPGDKLQERRDNYLTLCDRFGVNIIDTLLTFQDPWSREFLILAEQ